MKQSMIIRNDKDRANFIKRLNSRPIEKPILIEWDFYKKRRSAAQNSLYWMWVGVIRMWLWDSGVGYIPPGPWMHDESIPMPDPTRPFLVDELHEHLKETFLDPVVLVFKSGELRREIYSTKKLTVSEFSEYMTRIEAQYAEKGCALPHPTDLYNDAMGVKS